MSDNPTTPETVRNIKLHWAVSRYGSLSAAVDIAQRLAIVLLQDDQESSREWAQDFMMKAAYWPHKGDCGLARTWEQGPVTCSACIYDEFMLKAWQHLRAAVA